MKSTDQTSPSAMLAQAIVILGGVTAAARILDVPKHRYQTVQGWIRERVPADYCPAIEQATAERGKRIQCERLRPDIAWNVLRDSAQG